MPASPSTVYVSAYYLVEGAGRSMVSRVADIVFIVAGADDSR